MTSSSTYLDSPDFLKLALHTVTLIEIPVHLVGAYSVLFRTPRSMHSVKWTMFNLHFWSMALDLTISCAVIPYVLYPVLGGYALGVLSVAGVDVGVQCYAIVVLFANVGFSFVAILENRYFLLFARDTFWKHVRRLFLLVHFLATIFFFLPSYFAIPEQNMAREIVVEMLPYLPDAVNPSSIFVFATRYDYVLLNVSTFLLIICSETIVFILLFHWNLQKTARTGHLSKRTIALQHHFIRAVYCQVAAPFLVLVAPLTYLGTSVLVSYYNQGANNVCYVLFAMHGFISTVVMVLIHKPYRDGLCCLKLSHSEHTDTNSTPKIQRRAGVQTVFV